MGMTDRLASSSAKRTARNLATKALTTVRRALATGRTNALIRRLGLQPILVNAYWRLLSIVSRKTYTQEVGQASVTIHAASVKEYRHYRTLVDERPVLEDLLARLEDDDVFYDVGGYVGSFACFAAAVLPPGHVVSFEPRERKAARIEANLATNGFDATVRRHGLSDSRNERRIVDTGRFDDDAEGGERVSTVAGDDLVASGDLPAPTVLKIDVEGHEVDVIRGLSKTIESNVRLVYCEVHPTIEPGIGDAVRELLEDAGFSVERVHERGKEYFLRAERNRDRDGDGSRSTSASEVGRSRVATEDA